MTSDVEVRHPDVVVPLTGVDGNSMMVLGLVSRELKRAGYGDEVPQFQAEATSSDWGHLITTVSRWVNVS